MIDTASAPIWLVRYPREGRLSDYEDMVTLLRQLYEPGKRYSLIFDLRDFNPFAVSRKVRKQAAALLKEEVTVIQEYAVSEARIAPGLVMSTVLTVFDWRASVPWATANFTSPQKAEAWTRSRLADAHISVPTAPIFPAE